MLLWQRRRLQMPLNAASKPLGIFLSPHVAGAVRGSSSSPSCCRASFFFSHILPWYPPLRPAGPAPPKLILSSSKATSSARTSFLGGALLNFDLCQQPEVSGVDARDRPRGQLHVLCVRTACTIELQAAPGLVKVNYSDELVLNSHVIFSLYCAEFTGFLKILWAKLPRNEGRPSTFFL